MLKISVLGSGSSGNCAAVVGPCGGFFLVDAGLSAKQICLRLEAVGLDVERLCGVVLTHEHGDHVRGLDVLCRKYPRVPVYCTRTTREVLAYSLKSEKVWRLVTGGGAFTIEGIEGLEVSTFPVPHDAVEPLGMVVRCGGAALGIVSDVGHVTGVMKERLQDLDALFIEANYDEGLLDEDTKRPWSIKQRISAKHGHLSNRQTGELLREVAGARLQRVLLGHLSEDCNSPALAVEAALGALADCELVGDVPVQCAGRAEPTGLFEVVSPVVEEEGGGEKGAVIPMVQAELF